MTDNPLLRLSFIDANDEIKRKNTDLTLNASDAQILKTCLQYLELPINRLEHFIIERHTNKKILVHLQYI